MPSPPVGGAQAQAGSARPRIPNGCRTESPCGTENRSPKKRGTRHRIAEKKQNTARQPLPRMIAPVPASPRHSPLWYPQRGRGLPRNFIAIPYDYVQISCPHRSFVPKTAASGGVPLRPGAAFTSIPHFAIKRGNLS